MKLCLEIRYFKFAKLIAFIFSCLKFIDKVRPVPLAFLSPLSHIQSEEVFIHLLCLHSILAAMEIESKYMHDSHEPGKPLSKPGSMAGCLCTPHRDILKN